MGALLAYEVARGLLASAGIEPRALFVSAHSSPNLPMRRRNWHDLPRDALIAELKALNGTPAEVFENEDLVDLVLPMLRSDLELVESYVQPVGPMLSCPVVAMGGTKDLDVTADELNGWSSVSTGSFKSTMLEGDHFFINSERTLFLDTIRRELVRLGLE
jgi:medium-chain acyl-[acyl-carrier-protein] hydrolase